MPNAAEAASPEADGKRPTVVHPLYVRIAHWINAVAVVLMIMSGWQIYNAAPLYPFTCPSGMTLGGWLAGALLWHFAAMWVFVVNGLVYVVVGLATGRLRRRLWPIRPGELLRDVRAALTGRLGHADAATYNAVQKALYLGVLLAGVVIVASGLAMWKPVQFQELAALLGGYEAARHVHFLAMAAIVLFLLVHVVMALIVPRSLRAMIRGR